MHVAVFYPARSVSLSKVASHIISILNDEGHDVTVVTTPYFAIDIDEKVDAAIFVHVFDPMVVGPWVYKASSMRNRGYSVIFYTTVEGTPILSSTDMWMIRDMNYIANSEYTRKKLSEVGADAPFVIYHGVDTDVFDRATDLVDTIREEMMPKGKVKLLYVAAGYPRKGHDIMAKVMKKVDSDFHLYVITDQQGASYYYGMDNVTPIVRFGDLSEEEIAAMYMAADFYVHGALSEGFGMPLAEAMCAQKMVVHPDYQPLTEVTAKEARLLVPVRSKRYVTMNNSMIRYEYHIYDLNEMALTINELKELSDSELAKARAAASKRCEELDAKKVYMELLNLMNERKLVI